MDFKIFIITIFLGLIGTVILGNYLNLPDAGAVIAVAFVGGTVIRKLDSRGSNANSDHKNSGKIESD